MYDTLVTGELDAAVQPRLGSRGDLIANEIKRAILTGRYKPGDPLVEKAIAEELGTSKTPVRDALKALSGTGLVSSSSHRGTSVRVVDAAMALAVCDIRLLLEPEAVRRSVVRGLDAAAFDAAFRRMVTAEAGGDVYERSLANRAFHRQLYARCANPVLVDVLDGLTELNALISVTVWEQAGSFVGEAAEHRKIAKAALSGQAEVAADRLRGHIEVFQQRVLEALGGS
ncbi:MAG: GntR family transcriptional regulator [Acidimicrobiales bacterium]